MSTAVTANIADIPASRILIGAGETRPDQVNDVVYIKSHVLGHQAE